VSGTARNRLFAAIGINRTPHPAVDSGTIVDSLPLPVVVLDADDRFCFANPAAEQFLGVSFTQLRNLKLTDIIPIDNPLFLLLQQVRAHEVTACDYDLTLESPRLHKRDVAAQGSPLPEEPGAVLLLLQDASAVRALDRQLAFRGAARSVSGMSAILAHEVKNPLSGIRGAAQLLEASVPEQDRELAILIKDEADRIRAIMDRMDMFSEKPLARAAVNVHRVLEHVRRLAQNGFAAGIRFQEFYDPSLPPVWGNRDQLIQAVLNLIKNAAEALSQRQDSEIVLSTAFQHGMRLAVAGSPRRLDLPLLVSVRDNGPGIPEDILPHLFEPFITTKASGSGLGLALVAKIIGDHGGLIEVDSRPGRTEFRLHLPVVTDEDSDP
jgi:two-component system, NtrC family, nitrogen regulation sensor histidine kinase GlnL